MATCPLGFGGPGARKDGLSPYHCALCRGLLHDPVAAQPCRHVFCAFCVRRFQDCPVCGADIEHTNPDSTLALSISKILLGHAKLGGKPPGSVTAVSQSGACPVVSGDSTSMKAGSCPVGTAGETVAGLGAQDVSLDLPSLLLQLALQSLNGGNPEAAISRLDMCADSLCNPSDSTIAQSDIAATTRPHASAAAAAQQPAAATPCAVSLIANAAVNPLSSVATDNSIYSSSAEACGELVHAGDPVIRRHLAVSQTSSEVASRLGAVHGCKADCYRRLGDLSAALHHYSCSLACLAPWRGCHREADSSISVTHNKLGDMLLMADRLMEAQDQYERALEIRRQAAAVFGSGVGDVGGAGLQTAPAKGENGASSTDEVIQDLCDLAVSLCKVVDVGFTILQEEQQIQRRRATEHPEEAQPAASQTTSLDCPESEPTASAQPGPQQRLANLAALLSEAREVLLRRELQPYARACGQPTAAGAAGLKEAAVNSGGSSSPASLPAGVSPGGGSVSEKQEACGEGSRDAVLLVRLVTRYSKVWGVLEQLSSRLRELQLAGI